MRFLKGNAIYGQSGGPTSIINTSFYGIIEGCKNSEYIDNLYVMNYGIEGLLNENLSKIDNSKDYCSLIFTPGAFAGSNRYKIKDYKDDETDYLKLLEIFKKYNIHYFFYNGGNDSMHTLNKIGEYFKLKNYPLKVIGIPKTIDNDLYNNYFSLGFLSASNFIKNATLEIALDDYSYKKGRVNIIETMGRNAGWLASSSLLIEEYGIDIDILALPEVPFDVTNFLAKVKEIYESKGHCLVVISEGIKNKDNKLIYKANLKKDEFNHHSLGGISHYLCSLIEKEYGYKTRAFELSLLQRASSLTLSEKEVKIAIKMSKFLVKEATLKDTNFKVGCIKLSKNNKLILGLEDLENVANFERKMDQSFFNLDSSINKDKVKEYFNPLKSKILNPYDKDGFIKILKK